MIKLNRMRLILMSTSIGYIGSGRGGGVELTLTSLIKGLDSLGHELILVAPEGSILPEDCSRVNVIQVPGDDQPSWQHQDEFSPIVIPRSGVLPNLLEKSLELGEKSDAVLNFSYDWLPIWLTKKVKSKLFHLISMGGVSDVMRTLISQQYNNNQNNFAFHTYRQASDYDLASDPIVLGNGFDLTNYELNLNNKGPIAWAGRVAPEKGLEDAVAVASSLNDRLLVCGVVEDLEYAERIESSVPSGTIEWKGFLPTEDFQKQLGECRVLLNTPKWNEAYGNVVVEAMACGVPVIAYDRGGPGELIDSGLNGFLVPPDDIQAMKDAIYKIDQIDRSKCREWVQKNASHDVFANKVIDWISAAIG